MKTKRPSATSRLITFGLFTLTMSAGATTAYYRPQVEVAQAHEVQTVEVATESAQVSGTGTPALPSLDTRSVASSSARAKDQSVFIDEAVQEFLPTHYSEALMIMHCLAHRENGHGGNPNAHGDNGKAGGPFQFHQPTWDGYRKLMMKEGKATEIGSRYDFKEAARTTAWALSTGRAKAWGPIYRDMNGSDYATCQTPSWSK